MTFTPTQVRHVFRQTLCAASAASVLALGACGGDDAPPSTPEPKQLLSDCPAFPTQARAGTGTSVYAVEELLNAVNMPSFWATGQRADQDTYFEPATLNGQPMRRERTQSTYTYESPQRVAGTKRYDVLDTYYTVNDDRTLSIHGAAYAYKWDTDEHATTVVTLYEPPYTLLGEAAVPPGTTVKTAFRSSWQRNDGAQTTSGTSDELFQHTYVGQEVITVPAGTFATCKTTLRFKDDSTVESRWVQKGVYGPNLKTESQVTRQAVQSMSGYR